MAPNRKRPHNSHVMKSPLTKHRFSLDSLQQLWVMYLFLLPTVVFFFVFNYLPMYGILLGFKNFRFDLGIWRSPWAGLRYVRMFLGSAEFPKLIRNTLAVSVLRVFFTFPAPIILALLVNEVRAPRYKRIVQTISYLPHFVSWVVVIALFQKILSPYNGAVNDLLVRLGHEPVYFMASKTWFYPIVLGSAIWKEIGWGAIIYLAALSGVNPELYESAQIDGASRWRQVWSISLPSILPTIGILLILSLSNILRAGFDQLYLLYHPAIGEIAEVFDTYVVKVGIRGGLYSYATVAGLFQSIVSLLLVIVVNRVAKVTSGGEVYLW